MFTLGQLAHIVDGTVVGDSSTVICNIGSLNQSAPENSIIYIDNEKMIKKAEQSNAVAIIAPEEITESVKPLLSVAYPKLAFAKICGLFVREPLATGKIHPQSSIHASASIGKNSSVHPFAVISEDCVIGDDCVIGPGVFIGKNVKMGHGCKIKANTVIEHDTGIGSYVTIHGGSVIGADGFGFVTTKECHHKFPHLGSVIIEDHVEIFANVTIDRGTIGPTVIGSGSKLGDMVHIGHNVQVGEQCIIAPQVVIGGSTNLGRRVIVAGKAGISDHLQIGSNVVLAAATIVLKDVKDNSFLSGHPAMDHQKDYRIKAAVRKLPEWMQRVTELQKKVSELEAKLREHS